MNVRARLIRLHWFLSAQLGIDPIKLLRSIRGCVYYIRDLFQFRSGYAGTIELQPCLHDRFEEGGATQSEYFWQDLLVARWIHAAQPKRHVDVGSRVDGFVAHVAAYREIEVFDVRPITSIVPGIVFRQANLMDPNSVDGHGFCDSLSCLHAIEHFGLGRYGDPINPHGYEQGIANLAQLLKPGGIFYLSTPIGQERVEFNANRVFDPRTIIRCAKENELKLLKLTSVRSKTIPTEEALTEESLNALATNRYTLGIFVFKKLEKEAI
jgi:hypothetical protein